MANRAYISRDILKSDLGITDTDDDAAIRRAIEEATEQIEVYAGGHRRFQPYTATRVYTAVNGRCVLVDDLLSVTSLKTDDDDDYDYDTATFATTDYSLRPPNAAVDEIPYTEILTKPNGVYSFPTNRDGVQIVGKWGFWEKLETLASVLTSAVSSTSATTIPVTSGTEVDVLDTILIDSEQMYVTAISSNNLTVIRGVNGTTAATHLINAPIYRYVYPPAIVAACRKQAAHLYQSNKAPGSDSIGSGDVAQSVRRDLPWDIRNELAVYRHPSALV